MKNPGIAVVLSFFWTGLGQIYNGQIMKGLIMMGVQYLIFVPLMWLVVGLVLAPILWLWSMYDAYRVAERYNQRLPQP